MITLERRLKAPLDRVWRMWTTAEGLERWWGPEGFSSKVTRLELTVGGGFEIVMTAVREDIVAYLKSAHIPVSSKDGGEYREIVERARLAWTKSVDFVPGVAPYPSDTVVRFVEEAEGVRVVVETTAMHDAHWTRMKTMGWEEQLDKLSRLTI